MGIRKRFENVLDELEQELLEMYHLAKANLTKSMEALVNKDLEKAKEVIASDDTIDEKEKEINNKAILLIAQQAPVATDLRRIIVALKISSEIERIADMAVNIADSVIEIGEEEYFKPIQDIPKMMDIALEMFKEAMIAFREEDIVKAKNCALLDDKVDDLYEKLINELMRYIPENRDAINQITQLAFVTRYIERVADHVTNISENTIYLVTGNRFDLNEKV